MSRVGIQPIPIPNGVAVNVRASEVHVKGPKGELRLEAVPSIRVTVEDGAVRVDRSSESREVRALHGLTRALVANMVQGVTQGYRKTLELHGTGYRAQLTGNKLVMQLGHSHPVEFTPPEGISLEVENPTTIHIDGIDKRLVGQVAADIRAARPVEVYLGKGIRYRGEYVRRKAGKAGKVGAGVV
ncbi:MAG: 50S ribosomal protein L6 [Chloroflexi bacterium]|nr:50S ribosomal protein L6 [Chloroflexota bacterium]